MQNQGIRQEARKRKVPLWMVADKMGISESSMTRRLRFELSEPDKLRIQSVITEIAEQNNSTHCSERVL